jgi:hypothetical protein
MKGDPGHCVRTDRSERGGSREAGAAKRIPRPPPLFSSLSIGTGHPQSRPPGDSLASACFIPLRRLAQQSRQLRGEAKEDLTGYLPVQGITSLQQHENSYDMGLGLLVSDD